MSGVLGPEGQARLSIQRALLGMVTPELRAIAMRVEQGRIGARFLFDHNPREDECELVDEIETEVSADFMPDVAVVFRAEGLPSTVPLTAESGERWVYRRREPVPD